MKTYAPLPSGIGKQNIHAVSEALAETVWPDRKVPLRSVVEKMSGKVDVSHAWTADGQLDSIQVESDGSFTITLSLFSSPARQNFTICHELGHLFLHWNQVLAQHGAQGTRMVATRWVDENSPDSVLCEREANWFASAFLMPSTQVKKVWERERSAESVGWAFGASTTATKIRLQELGLS